jgi:hypothetical protein
MESNEAAQTLRASSIRHKQFLSAAGAQEAKPFIPHGKRRSFPRRYPASLIGRHTALELTGWKYGRLILAGVSWREEPHCLRSFDPIEYGPPDGVGVASCANRLNRRRCAAGSKSEQAHPSPALTQRRGRVAFKKGRVFPTSFLLSVPTDGRHEWSFP